MVLLRVTPPRRRSALRPPAHPRRFLLRDHPDPAGQRVVDRRRMPTMGRPRRCAAICPDLTRQLRAIGVRIGGVIAVDWTAIEM